MGELSLAAVSDLAQDGHGVPRPYKIQQGHHGTLANANPISSCALLFVGGIVPSSSRASSRAMFAVGDRQVAKLSARAW
jgi:hypothetical protein